MVGFCTLQELPLGQLASLPQPIHDGQLLSPTSREADLVTGPLPHSPKAS